MVNSFLRRSGMTFWWWMFICNILVPVIMAAAGLLMWARCPKEINSFFGYRTVRSMKNHDTWKFAHRYAGRLFFIVGLATLVPTVAAQIPFYNSPDNVIGTISVIIMSVQLAIIVLSLIPTEIALKKNFNDDGTRKDKAEKK